MLIFSRITTQGTPSILLKSLFQHSWKLHGPLFVAPKLNRFAHERSEVKLKIVPPNRAGKELSQLGYEERNERIGRVLSPHLSIYSPQLTSMLSISQRISGMALTVYIWALGIGALLTSHDMEHFVTMVEGLEMSGTTLFISKFILSFPLTFHYFNAIRHVMWAFGNMLKLNLVYSTGYIVLVLTPLSAVGLSCL